MSDNKMEKEVEGFLTEAVVMLFQTIKDILKGLWYGMKKLKTPKAIMGFSICLLFSCISYLLKDYVVLLLEKTSAPEYIIRILRMFLLLMPVLYLFVIGRMEDKNKDRFLQIFKDINFKARDGKYPYFCAMKKDGKKVIYIFKANIPLEEWKTNRARLETALNCNILLISNGEDKKIVKLTTVPNHCKISEMLYWSDEFASKQNGVITVGQGRYDVPILKPSHYEECEWVGFNYAKQCKEREKKGIHFFLDDYQFIRIWNNIDSYMPMLQNFKYVMTPDFSIYTDFPIALQIFNHYRKHWIGAYLQEHGINVIPTISWSTEKSFEWCFDGEPTHSCVAVSSVGTQGNKRTKKLFKDGYDKMMSQLYPEQIILYGTIPEECTGNIIRINSFHDKFAEVHKNGRKGKL